MNAPAMPQPLPPLYPKISIEKKSGFQVTFQHAEKTWNVTAGCECRQSAFTLYARPRDLDKPGEMTVDLVCDLHGPRLTLALASVERVRTATERAIFGWAEARFHNDRRPQWGKTARGAIS
jgi:hypothetical protein